MSPPKKQESRIALPAWLRSPLSWLIGPGRAALIVLVLGGLFFGGWYLAWDKVRSRVMNSGENRVGPAQVEITPPPKWINSDIRGEVFREPSLGGPLSIMDDDLTDRIAAAFALHPWVARVRSVKKQAPALVKVDLEYRQPVCMVEVPGGLLPVDAEGVLLPSGDFSPIEAGRYPRVVGVDRKPTGPAGRRWGDACVIGGAEIAAAFGPLWDELKLQRIAPMPDPAAAVAGAAVGAKGDANRRPGEFTFALFTRGGTRIYWGYAARRQCRRRTARSREGRPTATLCCRPRHARRSTRPPATRYPHAAVADFAVREWERTTGSIWATRP